MKGTIVYKMSGSGNDFVVLDGRATDAREWTRARVAELCHRRTGVGADGLVVLTPEGAGAARMVYWNADGSRAAMCGNAALCSARLAVYLELAAPGELCLLTDAGPVRARAGAEGDRAEIGVADFELAGHDLGLPLAAGERWMAFATVGVPHLVLAVEDIEAVDVAVRGRALRHDRRLGPAGANVNFVAPPAETGGPWRIRTYERGVEGETLACGTGTVASGVAVASRGEATTPVRFVSRGGEELTVRATVERLGGSDVWLGGQGKLVFRAVWEG
jgi:diaminopimelate epimerase